MTLKYNLISTVYATETMLHNKFLTKILLGKQTDTCHTSTQGPYLISRKKKIIISRNRNAFYSL